MNEAILLAQENAGAWLGGGLIILWILLVLAGVVIWLWGLISAIKNPALDSTMRLVWVLVIIFTGFIGAVLYFIFGNSMTTKSDSA